MITARSLKHIGNKLGGNWCAGFIFLILTSVGETWYYSSNTSSGSSATGIDHNEKFHKMIINAVCSGLNNKYIFIPN